MIELDDAPAPTDDQHRRLADLVKQYVEQVNLVECLELEFKAAVAVLNRLKTTDLPEALVAVGYLPPSKPVISGHLVDFRERYSGTQLDDKPDGGNKRPLEDRLRGLQWLDENGHA